MFIAFSIRKNLSRKANSWRTFDPPLVFLQPETSLPCSQEPIAGFQGQLNPIHTVTLPSLRLHFNTLLPFTPRFSRRFLSFRSLQENAISEFISIFAIFLPKFVPFHNFYLVVILVFGEAHKSSVSISYSICYGKSGVSSPLNDDIPLLRHH